MNYLPINEHILNTHKSDCWAYYCYLRHCIVNTYMSFSNTSITIKLTLDPKHSLSGRIYADMGAGTWSRYKQNWEDDQILIVDVPTTMMPLEVFDKVHEEIMRLPVRSRSAYCRMYLYIYMLCHKHNNDYGTTVARLAVALGSSEKDMSKKISYFIDARLLRRMGKFNPQLGIPYRYFIPIELCSGLNK